MNRFLILIVVGLANWPLFAIAGLVNSFGSEQPVEIKDFRPHLGDEGMYSEVWSHGAWLKDGGDLGIDFVISNLGIGNHKGAFKIEFRDAKGNKSSCSKDYSEDEWKSESSGFHLKFGSNEVDGDMNGINLKVRCDESTLDLRFDNQGVPSKPGSGTLRFENSGEEKGFYSMVFTSPRAIVSGTLTNKGQKTSIDGVGNAYHTWTNIGPHQQARRWFRFNSIRDEFSIVLAELEAPSAFGSSHEGWALVYGPEGRIVSSARVRYDYDGFIKDQKAEEGYIIPRRVRIMAVDSDNTIQGTLTMTSIKDIQDPLSDLDFFRKAIVSRFTKPRDYYIGCNYTFNIKDSKGSHALQGESFFRYTYVNP
jgi:hypothetical protein